MLRSALRLTLLELELQQRRQRQWAGRQLAATLETLQMHCWRLRQA
jgi:cell division protein FtsB